LNATTLPTGVTPRAWIRFTHGLPADVPVLLLEYGDVVYVPEQRTDRQIAEKAHVYSSGGGSARQIAFTLVQMPSGPETPLPDVATFNVDAYALAHRPASLWAQRWGRLRSEGVQIRRRRSAAVTPGWAP
jgi:hypothetical protein